MFGLFGSKGVTKLRSVYTDYELINQIFQKLKDINNSEIRTRKAIRDNNNHIILTELEKQNQILGMMDYIMKVKSLRIGELNKARENIIKTQIKKLKSDIDTHTKEYKRHISNIKKNEDTRHVEYLNRHHKQRIMQSTEQINHLKKLLEETTKIKNELRKDCKKSIEDSQRIIHNIG
ncbi:hypothetical protein HOC35_01330 [Candidatus Woesearchaeota archaeon]|jgi:hypothetical protein|nr:hypothetical protein [Candidatus Woesearchaeota archaeon]